MNTLVEEHREKANARSKKAVEPALPTSDAAAAGAPTGSNFGTSRARALQLDFEREWLAQWRQNLSALRARFKG